jgi:hypothetical protein
MRHRLHGRNRRRGEQNKAAAGTWVLPGTAAEQVGRGRDYISPPSRFDHHGRLTPPSMVRVLPVI